MGLPSPGVQSCLGRGDEDCGSDVPTLPPLPVGRHLLVPGSGDRYTLPLEINSVPITPPTAPALTAWRHVLRKGCPVEEREESGADRDLIQHKMVASKLRRNWNDWWPTLPAEVQRKLKEP